MARFRIKGGYPRWARLLTEKFGAWLVAWLVIFAAAIATVWVGTMQLVTDRREAGAELVRQQAVARVSVYARQLDDLTDRLDQAGQALMREWQTNQAPIDYEKTLVGIYPRGKSLYVTVFDANGKVVQASYATQAKRLAESPFLEHHRTHCCDGWFLSPVVFSPVVGRDVLRLSHRLSHADGSFAGVLVFGMTPDVLTAFEDDSILGPRDFVTVRMVDGPVLATKLGAGQPPTIFYKAHPRFDANQGIRLEAGELFRDGRARYVAWRKHPTMPMVALAAISEDDAMAAVEATVDVYRSSAMALSAVLLLFCGVGVVLAGKIVVQREAEEEVRQVYRTATDAADEGFYMLRPQLSDAGMLTDFQFEDVNERGGFLLGTTRGHLAGQPASLALSPTAFNDLLDLVQKALTYQTIDDERRIPADEKLPAKWLYRRAVKVGPGVALTLRDISATKAHEEELLELAHRDALTGLPNRLWLHRYLPTATRRARHARRQFAVLFIDLDHFKTVNDTLGHDAGDQLLTEVVATLRAVVRASDHVVRLGGDEFLVLVENVDDPASVEVLSKKIIAAITKDFKQKESPLNLVGASIGISLYPRDGERVDELLKHADLAMYEAKAVGRGRACWYRPEFSLELAERLGDEQALRKALERDELMVYYQPKFEARTGKMCGAEALLRWQRPERGLVMPGAFIALAEKTDLIVPVGERVVEQVVAQLAAWQRAGWSAVPVAINVSPEQLRRADVASFLREQLHAAGIPPSLIEVEITESAMVDQGEAVQQQLARLRELGVRLMIDDFGAGYSSLSQLQRLDVDGLKMDRELVAPLSQGAQAESLCRAIIWMARALDLRVVAEGVETVEQMRTLVDIGCDELQGYFLSEPLPVAQFEHLLQHPTASMLDWRAQAGVWGEGAVHR